MKVSLNINFSIVNANRPIKTRKPCVHYHCFKKMAFKIKHFENLK